MAANFSMHIKRLDAVVLSILTLIPVCLGIICILVNEAPIVGWVLAVVFGAAWSSAISVRIVLSKNKLEKRFLFFSLWSIDLENTIFQDEGYGGDLPIFPAYLIVDKRSKKTIGKIIKSQFRPEDVLMLIQILRGANVEFV